jgi:hypothetical protein
MDAGATSGGNGSGEGAAGGVKPVLCSLCPYKAISLLL